MNTAQGGTVSSIGYVVLLVLCLVNAYRWEVAAGLPRRPHPAAVLGWLVVAVPSLVQLAVPAVFTALERTPAAIEHGQVWRLLTSVVVQDGGTVGTVFNLVALALTLPVAVVLWRTRGAVALFVAGALLFNLLATFAWHDAGGGNSAATFFLATSMLGLLAARHHVHSGPIAGIVVIAVGIVLLATGDAHGVAVLTGLATGYVIGRGHTTREGDTAPGNDTVARRRPATLARR